MWYRYTTGGSRTDAAARSGTISKRKGRVNKAAIIGNGFVISRDSENSLVRDGKCAINIGNVVVGSRVATRTDDRVGVKSSVRTGNITGWGSDKSIRAYKSANAKGEGWVSVTGEDCFIIGRDCYSEWCNG